MKAETDSKYFRRRLEQARRLAEAATDPAVACAHMTMATLYEEKLERLGSLECCCFPAQNLQRQ